MSLHRIASEVRQETSPISTQGVLLVADTSGGNKKTKFCLKADEPDLMNASDVIRW